MWSLDASECSLLVKKKIMEPQLAGCEGHRDPPLLNYSFHFISCKRNCECPMIGMFKVWLDRSLSNLIQSYMSLHSAEGLD